MREVGAGEDLLVSDESESRMIQSEPSRDLPVGHQEHAPHLTKERRMRKLETRAHAGPAEHSLSRHGYVPTGRASATIEGSRVIRRYQQT